METASSSCDFSPGAHGPKLTHHRRACNHAWIFCTYHSSIIQIFHRCCRAAVIVFCSELSLVLFYSRCVGSSGAPRAANRSQTNLSDGNTCYLHRVWTRLQPVSKHPRPNRWTTEQSAFSTPNEMFIYKLNGFVRWHLNLSCVLNGCWCSISFTNFTYIKANKTCMCDSCTAIHADINV